MLDKHMIEKRICHVKEHGDNAQDIRDLAMLMYVKEHMDDHDDLHEHHHVTDHPAILAAEPMRMMTHEDTIQRLADLYNAAGGKDREIIRRAMDEIRRA